MEEVEVMTVSSTSDTGDGLLDAWGSLVEDAFGHTPYLVGTSAESPTGDGVRVRIMLNDEEWRRILRDLPAEGYVSPRWVALCMAVSAWGQQFTGRSIDFQFQWQAHARYRYDGPRKALRLKPAGDLRAPIPDHERLPRLDTVFS
jgi:hypothetical protein